MVVLDAAPICIERGRNCNGLHDERRVQDFPRAEQLHFDGAELAAAELPFSARACARKVPKHKRRSMVIVQRRQWLRDATIVPMTPPSGGGTVGCLSNELPFLLLYLT